MAPGAHLWCDLRSRRRALRGLWPDRWHWQEATFAGTNMILRCRALQDCGWFPTESVTEDWELGMRMVRPC